MFLPCTAGCIPSEGGPIPSEFRWCELLFGALTRYGFIPSYLQSTSVYIPYRGHIVDTSSSPRRRIESIESIESIEQWI